MLRAKRAENFLVCLYPESQFGTLVANKVKKIQMNLFGARRQFQGGGNCLTRCPFLATSLLYIFCDRTVDLH